MRNPRLRSGPRSALLISPALSKVVSPECCIRLPHDVPHLSNGQFAEFGAMPPHSYAASPATNIGANADVSRYRFRANYHLTRSWSRIVSCRGGDNPAHPDRTIGDEQFKTPLYLTHGTEWLFPNTNGGGPRGEAASIGIGACAMSRVGMRAKVLQTFGCVSATSPADCSQ